PFDRFVGDSVPRALREHVEGLDIRLGVSRVPEQEPLPNEATIDWVYVLVAPFPTVVDGVSLDEVRLAWSQGTMPEAFNGSPLLMESSTRAAFTELWGPPAADAVRVLPADQLLD